MLLTALVAAQSAAPYGGGGLNTPRAKGAAGEPPPQGLTLSSNADDKRAAVWKVYGRYQFTETWAAEVLYADKGRRNPGNGMANGVQAPTGAYPSATTLWNLAATGSLPLARGFSLTGKVGYARADIASSPYCLSAVCGPIVGGRRQLPFAGLGLGYSFSDAWGMRFEYENASTLRLDGSPNSIPAKGDNWSARIKYTF